MDNQEDAGGGYKKKKSRLLAIMRWMVYSVSIIVIAISAYRCASIGMPAEIKNYIIKSRPIERACDELGDDFAMYALEIRSAFGRGDALFADNVYYLESAENLQFTLRCKTNRFPEVFGGSEEGLTRPFKTYLKISKTSGEEAAGEGEEGDYIVLEAEDEAGFGKNKDSYVYFVYSFGGVSIDYEKSKLELYVFDNTSGSAGFDEDDYMARFTLFDVNMPKKKVPIKQFANP